MAEYQSTYSIHFVPQNINTFVQLSILKVGALISIFTRGRFLKNECHAEFKYKQRDTHEEGKSPWLRNLDVMITLLSVLKRLTLVVRILLPEMAPFACAA